MIVTPQGGCISIVSSWLNHLLCVPAVGSAKADFNPFSLYYYSLKIKVSQIDSGNRKRSFSSALLLQSDELT